MDYAVWNTLHDGSIEAISGSVPGDVEVHVAIAYLCAKLPTSASTVVVHLRGCQRFEYRPFEGDLTADLSAIVSADLEVLGAKEDAGSVSVACVSGVLDLSYLRADITLEEGRAISQAELESAAERYWTEWEANARRPDG